MEREHITNLPLERLQNLLCDMGQPIFRYTQFIQWLYQKRVSTFSDMHNLPKKLRDELAQNYYTKKLPVKVLQTSSDDSTVKFGFEAAHTSYGIESVLIIEGKRRSLCVSSQLGCGLGCTFCETGKIGFIRNLTQHEILGQVIAVNDYLAKKNDTLVTNIIFMGMGEALSNYTHFISTLSILMHPSCFGIGGRKITVSTAGIIPSLEKLLIEPININVAISLNSFNNVNRTKIMPINKRYPIEDLVKIARKYFKIRKRPITFEYVLIENENDTEEAARALSNTFKRVPCKINLIPLNPFDNETMKAPTDNRLNTFAKRLSDLGLTVVVRKSRGRDIQGACGQLSGKIFTS